MDNFGNRKVVFKALVGSHNYGLNDETSDKDYKYFVLPTFDDLYSGNMFSTSKVGTKVDYDVHDVRKLTDLFWKANVNFLEVLYSKELKHQYVYPFGCELLYPEIQDIFIMRQQIVTMNLRYLYSACKGMYFEKMKRLEKGTEGTQHLVEKHGYDTKQALHAIRVLDFCMRFSDNGWNFEDAFMYDEVDRHNMLKIKHGEFTLDDFKIIAGDTYEEFLMYEPKFKSQPPDLETKGKLESLIKELVRNNI